jgi:sugar phosphate isomerase/epimerase
MNINYYTDPGHGWAACKIDTLRDLGIADAISHYSYMRGRTAYLEEDCDFARLLDALAARGIAYVITEKHTNRRSPIRSYATYKKPADVIAQVIAQRSGVPAGRLIVKVIA